MFYDNKTHRLQTYVLMSWIRIDFYGLRLRSWSLLCVTFHTRFLSMHYGFSHRKFHKLRWASTLNQKTSFCDDLLVHNPIWVWSKILDGDSNIPQDYRIYTYFSSHFPSLLCSRTSIVQAWGRSHDIISDKRYVSIMLQKFWGAKEKMKKNMMRRKEK
jgi:hypothetical protein